MKFTIRDLLWLTVVVAAVLGWWTDRRSVFLEKERFRIDLWSANLRAETWKGRAERMANGLKESGWDVEMDESSFYLAGPPVNDSQLPNPSSSAPNPPSD